MDSLVRWYRTGENPSMVADDEDGLELSHLLAWGHLAGRENAGKEQMDSTWFNQ